MKATQKFQKLPQIRQRFPRLSGRPKPRLQIVCEGSTPCVTFPSCHQTQLKSCGLWSRHNLRRILEVVAVLNLPVSYQWNLPVELPVPQTVPLNCSTCCQTLPNCSTTHSAGFTSCHTVRFCWLPTDRRVFVETKLCNPRHVESQRSSHDAIVVAIKVLKNPGVSRSNQKEQVGLLQSSEVSE